MFETHHISTSTPQLQCRKCHFPQRAMPRAMPRVPLPWVACRGRPRRRGGPATAAARRTRRTRCTSASSAAAACRRRRKRCVSSAKTTNGDMNDLNWKSEKRKKIARSKKKRMRKIISTLWCWLYPKSASIVMPREIGCPAMVEPTYGLGSWNLYGAWCLVRRWNLWSGAWGQCLPPRSYPSPMMPRLGWLGGWWDGTNQFLLKQKLRVVGAFDLWTNWIPHSSRRTSIIKLIHIDSHCKISKFRLKFRFKSSTNIPLGAIPGAAPRHGHHLRGEVAAAADRGSGRVDAADPGHLGHLGRWHPSILNSRFLYFFLTVKRSFYGNGGYGGMSSTEATREEVPWRIKCGAHAFQGNIDLTSDQCCSFSQTKGDNERMLLYIFFPDQPCNLSCRYDGSHVENQLTEQPPSFLMVLSWLAPTWWQNHHSWWQTTTQSSGQCLMMGKTTESTMY